MLLRYGNTMKIIHLEWNSFFQLKPTILVAFSATSVDTFELPTVSPASLSTSHSLNSNAILQAVLLTNGQPTVHYPLPSKPIDGNHSLHSPSIASLRTIQHFNIDEIYNANEDKHLGKIFPMKGILPYRITSSRIYLIAFVIPMQLLVVNNRCLLSLIIQTAYKFRNIFR